MPEEPTLPETAVALPTPTQEAVGLGKWRRLLTVTATLLALATVVAVVVRLGMAIHHTLLLFVLGGLVAYALEPLVALVRRIRFGRSGRGLSRSGSVILVFIGLIALCVGGVAWLGGHAAAQARTLQRDAPAYRERAIRLAREFDANALAPRGLDFSLAETIENPPPEAIAYGQRLGREALPLLGRGVVDLFESVVVLLIAFYLLVFGKEMKAQVNAALPPFLRAYALPWQEDVSRILGGFVRGQLMLALIMGACSGLVLLAIGVHLWLLIGVFVAVASLIPVFGPYIGAVPAVLAALIGPTHLSPLAGCVVVVVTSVVVTEIGSKVLYPKLVGRALNLHEVVVLFVLFAGLEAGGMVGTLLAAPLTSLALVTLVHLYRLWQELPESPLTDDGLNASASRSLGR